MPLDAEALETLTGFGRDGDMKWNMVQQKDTQQHIEQQTGYKATRSRHSSSMSAKARLEAFPPGITVEGATPEKGRGDGEFWRAPSPPPRCRASEKKQGVAPSTSSPSRAARRARRGHAGRRPATLVATDAGNPFQPASSKAFQVKASPQRRGLRPLREERRGGQKRAPPDEPPDEPPLFSGA